MSKDYCITVSLTSESNGVLNQEIILREWAATEEELVHKNFVVSDHVVPAVDAAMKALAGEGFDINKPGNPNKP